MKTFARTFSVVGLVGAVTACGHYNQNETIANVDDAVAAANVDQNDDSLDANLTILPKPKPSPAQEQIPGTIVVEKSSYVERADIAYAAVMPKPPVAKCLLQAGSYLSDVVSAGATSFQAKVNYSKSSLIAISRSSCQDGQKVLVHQGSGFRGLAITNNKLGTPFKLLPQLIQIPMIPVLPDESGYHPVLASDESSKELSEAGSKGDSSSSLPGSRCGLPPPPPVVKKSCSVYGQRANIRIEDTGSLWKGTVVAPKGLISANWIKDECEYKSEILVDASSLKSVLSSTPQIHKPAPVPGSDPAPIAFVK